MSSMYIHYYFVQARLVYLYVSNGTDQSLTLPNAIAELLFVYRAKLA